MEKSDGDDWVVIPLDVNDGIGEFNEWTVFGFPTGQMGAAAGSHFLDHGGTAPAFREQNVWYTISRTGIVGFRSAHAYDATGEGGVPVRLALPYEPWGMPGGARDHWHGTGLATIGGRSLILLATFLGGEPGAPFAVLEAPTAEGHARNLQNVELTGEVRINLSGRYQAGF